MLIVSGNSKFALYGTGKSSYSEEELQEYGLPKEYTKEEMDYSHLSEEMQEYVSYITGKIEILNESSIDKQDDVYKRWKDKSGISVKEFLTYAIGNGGIAAGGIDSEQGDFTTDEMFGLLIENIEKEIADDTEFEKILLKWLLFEERIKGSDICRLLYGQQILSVADDDYEKLVSEQIDAFSFMKKTIEQLEITPAQVALDPCSASAVVVQQKTGKILAIVSYLGYDNNRLANQMDSAYYSQLLNGMEYTDNVALESLQEYSKFFYLNRKSGVEIAESLPHVTDAYGISSAMGQGTHNYATVQLARYVNTLASRGDVFQLSLIKGVVDKNGSFVENETVLENKVGLSDSIWETVNLGMVQFAQNNSVLRDMEISIAGKTGTAQESKSRPDHALFVGYAPAETSEITIAVRVANGYGSSNATIVGRSIFSYYFNLESQEEIVTG